MEYGMELKQPSKRELSEFSTLKEFNEHIDYVLKNYNLTQSQRALLLLLSRYAVKFLGVCYLSVEKIIKIFKEDGKKISVSTIEKAFKIFTELGIVYRIKKKRGNGQFGVYWTVFKANMRVENEDGENEKNDEIPCATTGSEECEKNDTIFSLKQKNIDIDLYTRKSVKDFVGRSFYKMSNPYCNDFEINELFIYSKDVFKKKNSLFNLALELDYRLIKKAFKKTVFAYKNNMIRKTFKNYYYSTLANEVEKKCLRQQRSQYYKAVETNRSNLFDIFA